MKKPKRLNSKLPPLDELQGAKARLLGLSQQLFGTTKLQFGCAESDAWVAFPDGREIHIQGYDRRLLGKISAKNRVRLAAHQAFTQLCREQQAQYERCHEERHEKGDGTPLPAPSTDGNVLPGQLEFGGTEPEVQLLQCC